MRSPYHDHGEMMQAQAPFPWFGGKSSVGPEVWERFGAVDNYVEPFAGSLAVLLAAPRVARTETVNDLDGFICNFWRALAADPEAVAHHADWPVNENDLHARHAWLVEQRPTLTARLEGDPEFYDFRIAGWWVWGICCWIGGGWCSGHGPWVRRDGLLVNDGGDPGRGVNRKLVLLGNTGVGVNRKLVHLSDTGLGVNRKSVGSLGEWFGTLADRLRRVRVCCGDWSRVCGPSPTTKLGLTAVFLDPPYGGEERAMGLYSKDSGTVSAEVRAWAVAHGDDPRMRIALCGYQGEHDSFPDGWTAYRWKAKGGYDGQGDGNNLNRFRETIWFSPACLKGRQWDLFEEEVCR